MDEEKQFNYDILEIIGIIIFMTIYALVGIYLFPFNLVFFPIPFVFLAVRRGIAQGMLSLVVVSITILFMVDIANALLFILLFLPLVYTIAEGIKSRRSSLEILGLSTAILFVSVMLFYSVTQNVTGINIMNELEESFNQVLNTQIQTFKEMGLTNFELLKTVEELRGTYRYVLWIFPVIILVASLFISYTNYFVSVIVLRKSGLGILSIPRFSRFKLPNNVMTGVIIMLLASFAVREFNLSFSEPLLLNVMTLIWVMFTIQGLSVIDFMFNKLALKLPLRIFFLGLIIIFIPLGTLVVLVGIIDTIFDIRKYKRSNA